MNTDAEPINVPNSGSRMLDIMSHVRTVLALTPPDERDPISLTVNILTVDYQNSEEDEEQDEELTELEIDAFVREFRRFLLFAEDAEKTEEVPESIFITEEEALMEQEEDCAICQSTIEKDSVVYALSCKHRFHKDCIEKWVPYKAQCPMCRGCIATKLKET